MPQEERLILRAQKLRGESVGFGLLLRARIVSRQTAGAARGVYRTVNRVRFRTELFEPAMQLEMAEFVQNHLELGRRVVVVFSVVIEAPFGGFEQRMPVLQKVRIRVDEFDLVFVFQIVTTLSSRPSRAPPILRRRSRACSLALFSDRIFPLFMPQSPRDTERERAMER